MEAPPSKAYTHRAVIAASLSPSASLIRNPSICEDTLATLKAVRMYGAKIRRGTDGLEVSGGGVKTPSDVIDCKGSGTTLRFVTPLLSFGEGISVLTGNRSLRNRPIGPLLEAMNELGGRCSSARGNGFPPVIVFGGGMEGGEAHIVGDVSSQFISAILLAGPKTRRGVDLNIMTPLESKPYVELTEKVLSEHNITLERTPSMRRFKIPSGQEFKAANHWVPGDYSSAAFLMAAAAVTTSKIRISNLPPNTFQADEVFVEILGKMGVPVEREGDSLEVRGGGLSGVEVDARDIPDLIPVCAVLGCFADDETVLRNVKRLQIKESDRVKTIMAELRKAGGTIHRSGDDLIVEKGKELRASRFSSHNDHRIAMACSVLALGIPGESLLKGGDCVKKSYPSFFGDLRRLGGRIHVG